MSRNVSKLLLLGCSRCKRLDEGLLPAIERYSGPAYRVLSRYLKQNPLSSIDVRILSAKFGLIPSDYTLPYYDFRMTEEQSEILRQQVIRELEAVLNIKSYTNLLIYLGRDYLKTIYGYESIIPEELTVQIAAGGLGRKLSILHNWLYDGLSHLQSKQDIVATKEVVRLRGVEVNLTSEQVLDVARQALATQDQKATHYQSWYVQVDNQRVAPKWLVSQITGLPVSSFHTGNAKKLLRELGIPVFLDAQI